jgi:hypothetical protein
MSLLLSFGEAFQQNLALLLIYFLPTGYVPNIFVVFRHSDQ